MHHFWKYRTQRHCAGVCLCGLVSWTEQDRSYVSVLLIQMWCGLDLQPFSRGRTFRYQRSRLLHLQLDDYGVMVRRKEAAALLSRALVGLELDKLFGHIVVVTLREDAQDGEARLIHVDAFTQRQPAGNAAFGGNVLQLQDSHAHSAVLTGEAVVLHTHLQLVALRTHLIAQSAAAEMRDKGKSYVSISTSLLYNCHWQPPLRQGKWEDREWRGVGERVSALLSGREAVDKSFLIVSMWFCAAAACLRSVNGIFVVTTSSLCACVFNQPPTKQGVCGS
ncbi:hypothetical protein INR49_030295 [Caranx melampygus]|nr:hypothetical protein INR49_030295 [Caranx melampygus]